MKQTKTIEMIMEPFSKALSELKTLEGEQQVEVTVVENDLQTLKDDKKAIIKQNIKELREYIVEFWNDTIIGFFKMIKENHVYFSIKVRVSKIKLEASKKSIAHTQSVSKKLEALLG